MLKTRLLQLQSDCARFAAFQKGFGAKSPKFILWIRSVEQHVLGYEGWQWGLGIIAALLVGISKTGIPGVATPVVPILAAAFGGRSSIGIMLPLLIMGDVFAVTWYRKHVQWDKLVSLLPWVIVGLATGAVALQLTSKVNGGKDILGQIIGWLVLAMLALYLLQGRMGDKLTPTSPIGVAGTGVVAGFSTMVSNAAGPVMTIYLTAHRLPKNEFIGTIAWYFFTLNVTKLPVYITLTVINPKNPIITVESLALNALLFPAVLVGVFTGKWLLPRIPQKTFEGVLIFLAGAAAVKLIVG
ncbi:MAG: sulfite exporter TauE/SafE family protein [Armatimonadetes bacterium]|nr:sulfite exporter TauE/SafE family protein [Armatimonadota bacterium]